MDESQRAEFLGRVKVLLGAASVTEERIATGLVLRATDIRRSEQSTFEVRTGAFSRISPSKRAPGDAEMDDGEAEDPMTEEAESGEDVPALVSGPASSSSVDWYGTEMSEPCLQGMAAQCSSDRGVPLLPRHGSWLSTVEWDEVMGRTVAARVEKAEVAASYEGNAQGLILYVDSRLSGCEKGEDLIRRLDDGQEIGMSIGGWFRSISVIYGEEDEWGYREVERVIIHEVQLDHIAVTRAPANPDCGGLTHLRSRLSGVVDELRTRSRTSRAGVTADAGGPPLVDVATGAGNDQTQETTSVRAIEPDPREQETEMPTMSADEIRSIVAESIREALPATIAETVRVLRSAEAEAPKVVLETQGDDEEVRSLREEVKRLRDVRGRLEDQVRDAQAGIHVPRDIDEDFLRTLVDDCKAQRSAPKLSTLIERNLNLLVEESDLGGNLDDAAVQARRSTGKSALTRLLRRGIDAALSDGLLTFRTATW